MRKPRTKLTQKEYIRRVKKAHGDKYDLSLTVYLAWLKPVTAICREHGPFEKRANVLAGGTGCPECPRRKSGPPLDRCRAEFFEKAEQQHGDRYDYSRVKYVNTYTPVEIICSKHGIFKQRPDVHITSGGCQECGQESATAAMCKYKTLEEILEVAREVHGDKYDYSLWEYGPLYYRNTTICPKHGEFEQTITNHLAGQGCAKCVHHSYKVIKNKNDFVRMATEAHEGYYDYSLVKKPVNGKVTIICPEHGEFKQHYFAHARGSMCQKCANLRMGQYRKLDTETVVARCVSAHGDTYDYSLVDYVGRDTPIEIICPEHGIFRQRVYVHSSGAGCPRCRHTGYSRIAIEWIEGEAENRGWDLADVQHALNGGEYMLPGTRIKVDGYHSPTNTVLEFHGDCFHGNPDVFEPDELCHPFSKETAKELYRQTRKREKKICKMGYNLEVMWENDYRNL